MPGTLVPGDGNWSEYDTDLAALSPVAGKYVGATAIARWDVIQRLTVASTFAVGMEAYHAAPSNWGGITSIRYYLNGGSATVETTPGLNPRTLRYQFYCYFDPASVSDGVVEIRAIVISAQGIVRAFSGAFDTSAASRERGENSLWLNANHGGTLPAAHVYCNSVTGNNANDGLTPATAVAETNNALQILALAGTRDGGTIHVTGGPAYWPGYVGVPWDDNDQYCTLSLEGDATLTDAYTEHFHGLGCTYQRIVGADKAVNKIIGKVIGQATDTPGHQPPWLLLDTLTLDGGGLGGSCGPNVAEWTRGWGGTNIHVTNVKSAIGFPTHLTNAELDTIGEDAIDGVQGLCADIDIHDQRQVPPNHSDIIQYNIGFGGSPNGIKNTILKNIKTRRVGLPGEGVQGFFLRSNGDIGTHKDIAIVDCDLSYAGNSQILHDVDHLVMLHSQFLPCAATATGGNFLIIDDAPGGWPVTTITNISVRNCVFYGLTATWSGGQDPSATDWISNCHFITGSTYGTGATSGGTLASLFRDPSSEDYRPILNGTLDDRTVAILIPAAIDLTARRVNGSIGPWEASSVANPVLADKTIHSRYGQPIHELLTNTGDAVTSVSIVDATLAPIGRTVAVESNTVALTGTSSPT